VSNQRLSANSPNERKKVISREEQANKQADFSA
jgi:hypothetical protein